MRSLQRVNSGGGSKQTSSGGGCETLVKTTTAPTAGENPSASQATVDPEHSATSPVNQRDIQSAHARMDSDSSLKESSSVAASTTSSMSDLKRRELQRQPRSMSAKNRTSKEKQPKKPIVDKPSWLEFIAPMMVVIAGYFGSFLMDFHFRTFMDAIFSCSLHKQVVGSILVAAIAIAVKQLFVMRRKHAYVKRCQEVVALECCNPS